MFKVTAATTISRYAPAFAAALFLVMACGPLASAPEPAAPPRADNPVAPSDPVPSPPPATPPAAEASPTADDRAIVISLSEQRLRIVENGTVTYETVVTTGQPDLATPSGRFSVMAKQSPLHWISPWPPGSPYYYPPGLVSEHAILFADGGYYIHDASWQANWGPGADKITGSHGCVNVPVDAMAIIFAWANVGDQVVVLE